MEAAGRRIAREATRGRNWIASLLIRSRIVRKDRAEARSARRGPSVQDRRDDLAHFYQRYEDLVETICDAAQYGPSPKLDKDYEVLRLWMSVYYPRLRPYLSAYLRAELPDEPDAFAALYSAPDLETFLREDDGATISRITRTREALNLYGEHLRQLAGRNL